MVGFNVTTVLPGTYQPTWLSSCVLWLRADQGITIGTGVSQWRDLSSGAHNATQATGGQQPTYNSRDSSYGSQPTLSFSSASSQVLITTASISAQPYTIVCIGQATNAGSNNGFSDTTGAGTGTIFANGSLNFTMYAGTVTPSAGSVANPSVMAGVFNGASSHGYVNASGSPVISSTPGTGAPSSALTVGGDNRGVAFLTGKIAEFMMFNTNLSTQQLHQIFAAAGQRYGQGSWT